VRHIVDICWSCEAPPHIYDGVETLIYAFISSS